MDGHIILAKLIRKLYLTFFYSSYKKLPASIEYPICGTFYFRGSQCRQIPGLGNRPSDIGITSSSYVPKTPRVSHNSLTQIMYIHERHYRSHSDWIPVLELNTAAFEPWRSASMDLTE